MKQAILSFTCVQIAASGLSLADLAALSGVCSATVRHLIERPGFRELESIERALMVAGLDVVGRDRAGFYHPVVCAAAGWRRSRTEIAVVDPPIANPCGDGLLAVLAGHCAATGLNAHRLGQLAGIPYASARRLLEARPMRVATTIQRILSALGVRLIAIAVDGSCLPIPVMPTNPDQGDARRRAHAECLRRWRQRHPGCHRDKNATGRLRIGKGDVVDLHRKHGMSYAEIGRIAGVSRHRVRQIVQLFSTSDQTQFA
jgi:hypothetical protein